MRPSGPSRLLRRIALFLLVLGPAVSTATRKEWHTLRGHRGLVLSVAFSPDGGTLATGGVDGTIRLWEVKTGRARANLRAHRSWVNGLTFSADGKRLASASSDGTVKLWDV